MIWQAVPYITTGLTLVAFLFAAIFSAYLARLKSRERVIKSAPESERGNLAKATLEWFDVDTGKLTKDQAYKLALAQINARSRRYTTNAIVFGLVFMILGGVLIFGNIYPPPPSSTLRVGILKPSNDEISFPEHYPIRLVGEGFDPQEGELKDQDLVWSRAGGGDLGRGRSVTVDTLGVGTHRIVLTATNRRGQRASASRDVEISRPTFHAEEIGRVTMAGRCGSVALADGIIAATAQSDVDHSIDSLNFYAVDARAKTARMLNSMTLSWPGRVAATRSYFVTTSGRDVLVIGRDDVREPKVLSRLAARPELGAVLEFAASERYVALRGLTGAAELVSLDPAGALTSDAWMLRDGAGQGGAGFYKDLLVVSARYAGLRVFDIGQPRSPEQIALIPGTSNDFSTNVLFSGDFSYIASWFGNLHTIYMADPKNPRIVNVLGGLGNTFRIILNDGELLAAGLRDGLYVLDLKNPAAPRLDAVVRNFGSVNDVAAQGDTIVLCGDAGLTVLARS